MQLAVLILAAAFADGQPNTETVRFKAKEVLVSDSDGVPLFRGKRDFVLKLGHNPAGAVMAYDSQSRRVRLSKAGTELWVQCSDLEPMTSVCPVPAERQAREAAIRGNAAPAVTEAEAAGSDVPSCPGDPRCPAIPE